ncbi:uncharacterized protein EDB91DRAFT_1081715 [Suillus paluster]|uniref:uncharacterized protein n=1 Tax=Suillus paluster TaxID=48578 RepID=UPI001B85F2EA|nr:uncharacterized protein EDB91DRAFT_1081715 [Suillus paluster]KAG1741425.1 hypothetical protein EDB91DRAFT_1081715 [Suillus paluster]
MYLLVVIPHFRSNILIETFCKPPVGLKMCGIRIYNRSHAFVAPNSATVIVAAKAVIRGFRVNGSTACDLPTIWNILIQQGASMLSSNCLTKKRSLICSSLGTDLKLRCSDSCLYCGESDGEIPDRSSSQSPSQVWGGVASTSSAPTPTNIGGTSCGRLVFYFMGVDIGTSPSALQQGAAAKKSMPPPSLISAAFPELPSSCNSHSKGLKGIGPFETFSGKLLRPKKGKQKQKQKLYLPVGLA